MEKIKIQFAIEDLHFQQTPFQKPGERVQDEETGAYYGRKYSITTKPFNYKGKEYSQLVFYTNSYLEFEGGIWISNSIDREREELKKHMWELWWWEGIEDSSYPIVRVNETEKKMTLAGGQLKAEKVCFEGDSLTISPTEGKPRLDERRGRLEVKIKPVKISEKIEINQLDFLGAGRLPGTDFNQIISDNFCFGKLVTIYFDEKRSAGLEFELEKDQTKLVIFPSYLKNNFHDYSWFSSVDDSNQLPEEEPPNSSSPASPFSNKEKLIFVALFVILGIAFSLFFLYKQFSKKKKKTNKFINNYHGRSFSFCKY